MICSRMKNWLRKADTPLATQGYGAAPGSAGSVPTSGYGGTPLPTPPTPVVPAAADAGLVEHDGVRGGYVVTAEAPASRPDDDFAVLMTLLANGEL